MDPEFLDHPVQGVSDLQACYDHALAGLVKAGTDLDLVGMEMSHAQTTFHNAINEYFNQLQLQIDNKDKAIRLMMEQKVETFDVIYSMQNQLAELQDEKTMLKTKNEYLTGILNANPSGTGKVLPAWMLQENSSDNVMLEVQNRTPDPLPNGSNHPALMHHTSLNRRFASFSNGDHGRDMSEIMSYRAAQRDQEKQPRDDEALETWKKSTMHTCSEEVAAYLSPQDARERQAAVRERCSGNAESCMQDVITQAQERLSRNPAPTLKNEINGIIKEQTARERLAKCEKASQCLREAWRNSSIYTSPDASRACLNNTNYSDVLARRLQSNGMELSHQGSAAQDSFQHESQPQVFQQQNPQKANYQQQRAGEVNAGHWAKYKQDSNTEAMESFRRQQAAHGWTITPDDRRLKGSTSKQTTKAFQPMGREPKLKAELESSPRKDHSVSVLDPRSPSFVPSNDKHGAAMTVTQMPPHKRLPKFDSLDADLNTASTSVNPAAVNSNLRNETSIPPHKRFPVASKVHKTPNSVEADTDLIALEDEIDPVTAIHQYTFKATTRKDQSLVPLDPNTFRPLPTVPNDSNGVTNRAPASSSLNELKELQTEATSFSPSYKAPMDPGISIRKPSQVWLEQMYKQAHDSSTPPANPSSPSTSPPAVDNAFGTVQGLPLIEKAKRVPVQRTSTPVLASSPVKSETNKLAHNTANARTETRVIKTLANSNFDTPFANKPSTMAEHEIDTRAESEATTPIASKARTPTPPQHFNLPKDNKTWSATFMAAAQSNLSTFATKYGRDPESETRKELAAKGMALKEKLASKARASEVGASLRVPEEQDRFLHEEYDRPTIGGTHVLGGVLDPRSKHLVIKPNSRGEWFEINLEWKPVVKGGRTCYIL